MIDQVDKTVNLVYTKYMKALISYEEIQRIEQFMFHQDAFLEILLNAIVHNGMMKDLSVLQESLFTDQGNKV